MDAEVPLVAERVATAPGIEPIPIWIVAPSGTSSATYSPMRRSTSPTGATMLERRLVHLDAEVDASTWTNESPEGPRHRAVQLGDHRVRGADGGLGGVDACPQRAVPVGIRVCETLMRARYRAGRSPLE